MMIDFWDGELSLFKNSRSPFQSPRTPSSRAIVRYASIVPLYLFNPSDWRTWAWKRTFTTSVGCANATAMAPVVQPAIRRVTIFASEKKRAECRFSVTTIIYVSIQTTSLILTLRSSGVELLHWVIKTDTNRCEAHLSLQSCHQAIVQTPCALCTHHSGDGAKYSTIFHHSWSWGSCRLSLDLKLDRRMIIMCFLCCYLIVSGT